MRLEFRLNGQPQSLDVDPRETLLTVLRERLQLMGTKYGCGEGECGACTVLLNGQPITSCLVLVGQVHGSDVITIEGMVDDPIGQYVISSYVKMGAVQCGFCTPGMVISTRALLSDNPTPSVEEIQAALGGNLCRCTGYTKIIDAVLDAGKTVVAEQVSIEGNGATYGAVETPVFVRPESLDEALDLLARQSGWQILGGMSDVGVQHEHHLKEVKWLDLSNVAGLREVREDDTSISIGGGATFSDILGSQALQQWAVPLVEAAFHVGAIQIQNRATLGGNLANASPAADAVPALYVLEATLVLRSVRGKRVVPVTEFATGPGQTVLAPDEILTEVIIPKRSNPGQELAFFSKLGPRKSQTIAIASVAFRGWMQDDRLNEVMIALGAVAPTVILAGRVAEYLMTAPLTETRIMEAGELAAEACQPISDVRASATYRRRLVRGLLVQGLLSRGLHPA